MHRDVIKGSESSINLNSKTILGYKCKGDTSSYYTPRRSPNFYIKTILDTDNILSLGAKVVEISNGDQLLKDYKQRASNFSKIAIPKTIEGNIHTEGSNSPKKDMLFSEYEAI